MVARWIEPQTAIVIWLYLVGLILTYLHLRKHDDQRTIVSLYADVALSVLWPATLLIGIIVAASLRRNGHAK